MAFFWGGQARPSIPHKENFTEVLQEYASLPNLYIL